MQITIKIDQTDNAAFGDTPEDRSQEICRLLRIAVRECEGLASFEQHFERRLLDINGNTVGKVEVAP